MSEQAAEDGVGAAARMAKAVFVGAVIGIPASIAVIMVAVMMIADLDLADAFATAVLPGVLFGAFAGGFAGVAVVMD